MSEIESLSLSSSETNGILPQPIPPPGIRLDPIASNMSVSSLQDRKTSSSSNDSLSSKRGSVVITTTPSLVFFPTPIPHPLNVPVRQVSCPVISDTGEEDDDEDRKHDDNHHEEKSCPAPGYNEDKKRMDHASISPDRISPTSSASSVSPNAIHEEDKENKRPRRRPVYDIIIDSVYVTHEEAFDDCYVANQEREPDTTIPTDPKSYHIVEEYHVSTNTRSWRLMWGTQSDEHYNRKWIAGWYEFIGTEYGDGNGRHRQLGTLTPFHTFEEWTNSSFGKAYIEFIGGLKYGLALNVAREIWYKHWEEWKGVYHGDLFDTILIHNAIPPGLTITPTFTPDTIFDLEWDTHCFPWNNTTFVEDIDLLVYNMPIVYREFESTIARTRRKKVAGSKSVAVSRYQQQQQQQNNNYMIHDKSSPPSIPPRQLSSVPPTPQTPASTTVGFDPSIANTSLFTRVSTLSTPHQAISSYLYPPPVTRPRMSFCKKICCCLY